MAKPPLEGGSTPQQVANFGVQFGNPMGPGSMKNGIVNANPSGNGAYYLQDAKFAYMGSDDKGNDVMQNVSWADTSYFLMKQDQRAQLVNAMDATFGKGKWKDSTLQSLYRKGLDISAYLYANASKKVDPVSATLMYLQQGARSGAIQTGGAGGTGTTVSTQTTKSVNLTDPMSARKLVNDALGQYLGRAATKQEQDNFMKALSQQERMNPSITKQTSRTTTTAGGGSSASTTSSEVMSQGGFNPSAFAEQYAKGMEGSGEYQAATSLLNTFIGALGEAI